MSDIKWIKIVTDIFDDEKILLIESMPDADSLIVIWFKLLCLAGKQNNSGVFVLNGRLPYTDEMFATIFRRPINTVRLALKTFEELGMIEIINNTVTIQNWGKHQNFDKIEAKTAYMREYMKGYREKQKSLTDGKANSKSNDKSNHKANVSEADKIREDEIREDKNREDKSVTRGGKPRFTPPTVDEVRDYCDERHNNVNAERFVDFYTANGWTQGRGKPIRDWRAAVRTWEQNDNTRQDSRPAQKKSSNPFRDMLKAKQNTLEINPEEVW